MSVRWKWLGLWAAVAVAEIAALVPILTAEALDGHLLVTSPPGAGAVVVPELPCAS